MEMRREPTRICHETDDFRNAIHRFERADPKERVRTARVLRMRTIESSQQLEQRRCRVQIRSIRSEVHSAQHDFFESSGHDSIDRCENLMELHTPRSPPGRRDDAIAARLRAPCLNGQGKSSATGNPRLDERPTTSLPVTEAKRRREAEIAE